MKTADSITTNGRKVRILLLSIIAWVLPVFPLLALNERIFIGKKDGIELHVGKPNGPAGKDASSCLSFTVTNTNDYELTYLDNSRGKMFSFTLLDQDRRPIEQIPQWYRRNDPYASDVGQRARAPIVPGEQLEFTICLKEAYGERWSDGKTLLVKWEPSDGNGGLIPIGWQLEAKCILSELLGPPNSHDDSSGSKTKDALEIDAIEDVPEFISPPSQPFEDGAVLKKPVKQLPSAQNAVYGISWVWIIGAVITLMAGSFWLGRKSSSHTR